MIFLSVVLATQPSIAGLSEEYLRALWHSSPMTATQAGYHADGVDQQLDDLSAAARARRSAWLRDFAARLAATRHGLGLEDEADAALLDDSVTLERLDLDEAHDDSRRCDLPLESLGEALFQMTSRTYAPVDQRAADVIARLHALPRYLEQARAALTVHVPDFRAAAVDNGEGLIEYLEKDLPAALAGAKNQADLRAAVGGAVAAVRAHLAFLAQELPKKPAGSYRFGAALYQKRFRPYLQTDRSAEEVRSAARARLVALRRAMAEVARRILGAAAATGADDGTVIRAALARVAEDHPAPAELFATVRDALEKARTFVRKSGVLTLGDRGNLMVIETPPFMRSRYAVAAFDGAPPLDPSQGAFYYVTPLAGSPERVASKLREYNRWMIDLITIHEAMPGHYVQFERANGVQPEARRVLRWVLSAGSYVEGWAVYAQDVMVEAGYRSHDPRLQLTALKLELRAVANAVLDIELHAHDLSDAAALHLMMDEAFQERSEAEAKLRRAKLSVTQLCSYFVGGEAWRALRATAAARPGFSARAFHDRALGEGAVTLPMLRRLVQ